MQQIGITGNVYNVIKSMYNTCLYRVHCGEGLSESIISSLGLKQGCNLSPNLSNIFQNDIHTIFDSSCDPVYLGDKHLNSLSWADDLVLISTSEIGLQNSLDALSLYCQKWSICINPEKTVYMIMSKRKIKPKRTLFLDGIELKHSNSVSYLGFHLTNNMDPKAMIADRMLKANRASYVLRQAISANGSNNIVDVKLATKLFDKMISPILLYGCCVWGVENSTNLIYLKNISEGNNTRMLALNELYKCGKHIEIVSARRVGRGTDTQPRDILVNLLDFEDKLFLLYLNKSTMLKDKICNYDLKIDNLAYESVHTKFLKVIL